jgi:micrococcal nuclease
VLRLGVLVLVLASFAALAAPADAGRFTLHGTVTHVVDGDTLDVRLAGGRVERIRLLGIDTPEVGVCGASRATGAARSLALGRTATLRGDATQATRDRYGRLLAYVWLSSGDLGYQLLRRGLARVYVFDRPFERLPAYRRAEAEGRGKVSCGAPVPVTKTGACDPSYPDVCIPPPPPDLDCRDVPHTGFRVVGRDPHRFDGDRDGIGCEG